MKYLIQFADYLRSFRFPELKSMLQQCGITEYCLFPKHEILEERIYILECDETEEKLAKLFGECLLIKFVYRLLEEENTADELLEQIQKHLIQKNVKTKTWKLHVETIGKKFKGKQKAEKNEKYRLLLTKLCGEEAHWKQEGEFLDFHIIENYQQTALKHSYFFTLKFQDGGFKIPYKYDLRHREYIGTTSMVSQLSFLCAHQAQIKEGDFVLDPFMGTGSLLISASVLGAVCIGCDVDLRVLKGKDGKDVYSNYQQYNMEDKYIDYFHSCFSQNTLWRGEELFDAIITDPPYGNRERAGKVGRKETKSYEILRRVDHIPAQVQWDKDDMMTEFLKVAAKLLVPGGRVVFWVPRMEDGWNARTGLTYPSNLDFENVSTEKVHSKLYRHLITARKKESKKRFRSQVSTAE